MHGIMQVYKEKSQKLSYSRLPALGLKLPVVLIFLSLTLAISPVVNVIN